MKNNAERNKKYLHQEVMYCKTKLQKNYISGQCNKLENIAIIKLNSIFNAYSFYSMPL